MLIMFKCKKVPLDLNEGEHLDVLVDLLPHRLGRYPELEQPPVFQPDQQLVVVLLVCVLVQFIDLAQREMHQLLRSLYENLVVAQNQRHLHVMPERILRQDEFAID